MANIKYLKVVPDISCLNPSEINKGTHYLNITIKMLEKYKNKLDINSIELTDNSFVYNNIDNILLEKLSFL